MGLKDYRLWAMGQLDSNLQSPTAVSSSSSLGELFGGGCGGLGGGFRSFTLTPAMSTGTFMTAPPPPARTDD
jgi:hypothetical protein